MPVSFSLFSGLSRESIVPAGSFAKASSVGAKTVNGPFPAQCIDEAGGLNCGDQGIELTRAGGDADDGLLFRGRGWRVDQRYGCCKGSGDEGEFLH